MQKQCNRGHFYDDSKYSVCPYCPSQQAEGVGNRTVAEDNGSFWGSGRTDATFADDSFVKADESFIKKVKMAEEKSAFALTNNNVQSVDSDGRTVCDAFGVGNGNAIEPIVGWLVAVAGKNMGRDYRVRTGRNIIGRGDDTRIRIDGDATISRHQAVIIYDEKKNSFSIAAAHDSTAIVYLNDEAVESAQRMNAYDIIEMGGTKLVFIPLCDDRFRWREYIK